MPIVQRKTYVTTTGLRLGRDRCAEVIVTIATPKRTVLVVLDGGDGSVTRHRTLSGPRVSVQGHPAGDDNPVC